MSYMLNNANGSANEKQTQPEYGPTLDPYTGVPPQRQYFPTPTQTNMLPTQTQTHPGQVPAQTQMAPYGAQQAPTAHQLIPDPYLPMQQPAPVQQTDLALYAYASQPAFVLGTLPLPTQAQMVQPAYAGLEVHPTQYGENVGHHQNSVPIPQKFPSLVDPLSYSPYGDYGPKYTAPHNPVVGSSYSVLPPLSNPFSQQNPPFHPEARLDSTYGAPSQTGQTTSPSLGLLALFPGASGNFGGTLVLSDSSQVPFAGNPLEPGRMKRHRRHTANVSQMTPETAARNRCSICNKQFKRPLSLQTHYYLHTGQKLFKCAWPNCGKLFLVKSNMTRHYKIHERDVKEGKTVHPDNFGGVGPRSEMGSGSSESGPDFDRGNAYKALE